MYGGYSCANMVTGGIQMKRSNLKKALVLVNVLGASFIILVVLLPQMAQLEKVLKITVFWETLRDIERVSLKTLRVSNAENSFLISKV